MSSSPSSASRVTVFSVDQVERFILHSLGTDTTGAADDDVRARVSGAVHGEEIDGECLAAMSEEEYQQVLGLEEPATRRRLALAIHGAEEEEEKVTPGSLSLYATPLDGTPPLDNAPLVGTSLDVALYKTPLDGTSLDVAVYKTSLDGTSLDAALLETPLHGTSLDVALYAATDAADNDNDDDDSGAPFPPLDPRLSHERIPHVR
jgi:hypothetical protein